MQCIGCRSEILEGSKYCGKCGCETKYSNPNVLYELKKENENATNQHKEAKENATYPYKKATVNRTYQRKEANGNGMHWVIVIAVFFLLWGMVRCSSNEVKQNESDAFNTQMHKDPSTWSKEEVNRYDGFIKWSDKQN